jgi:hypothetical protein
MKISIILDDKKLFAKFILVLVKDTNQK